MTRLPYGREANGDFPTSQKGSIRLPPFAPVVRIPVGLRFELVVEVDVLGLAELFEAFRTEFRPAARKALPAEGAGVVVRERVVDPEGAGLDALGGGHGVFEEIGRAHG